MAHLVISINKHQGVVLISVLLMVMAVTLISVTVMSSSNINIKIAIAAQERAVAKNKLMGEVHRVIAMQVDKGIHSYFFLTPKALSDIANGDDSVVIATGENTHSELISLNKSDFTLGCPRRFSVTTAISCNMVEISTTIKYGRKNIHELTIVTGISQEIPSLGKGI